jgi:hypothetical protein
MVPSLRASCLLGAVLMVALATCAYADVKPDAQGGWTKHGSILGKYRLQIQCTMLVDQGISRGLEPTGSLTNSKTAYCVQPAISLGNAKLTEIKTCAWCIALHCADGQLIQATDSGYVRKLLWDGECDALNTP